MPRSCSSCGGSGYVGSLDNAMREGPPRPCPRLNCGRIVTLNCGLGRDSITMLCLLIERRLVVEGEARGPEDIDAVIFADTGNEWPGTYALRATVAALCTEHGIRFEVVAKGDPEHYRPALMADFGSRSTVASLGKSDCTENHKILPIRRWINALAAARFGVASGREWGAAVRKGERRPHLTLIGFAADEVSRLEREGGRSPAYMTEAYPLAVMGIDKAGEAEVLRRHGLDHVRKSGCYCCPYQPPGWYWALYRQHPEIFAEVVAYEAKSLAANPRMNVTGIKTRGRVLTLPEVVTRWRERNPDATVGAVLAKNYTRCTGDALAERRADAAALIEPRSLVRGRS